MDQHTINRLGNIRHEEIVAGSAQEHQPNVVSRQWKFPNVFAFIRRIVPHQQPNKNFKTTASTSDC